LEQWKIQRDRSRCVKPGCPLASADEFFAVLELPACVRRDLCATCFHELAHSAAKKPIYWRARRTKEARSGPVLDLASLRILFDRLGEEPSEQARGLRFFVALLLLRKRLLKLVDPVGPEQEAADLVVVDPRVEGMAPFALVAPELDSERMASLKDELLAAAGEVEAGADSMLSDRSGGSRFNHEGRADTRTRADQTHVASVAPSSGGRREAAGSQPRRGSVGRAGQAGRP
jgi:hypothetical protein